MCTMSEGIIWNTTVTHFDKFFEEIFEMTGKKNKKKALENMMDLPYSNTMSSLKEEWIILIKKKEKN